MKLSEVHGIIVEQIPNSDEMNISNLLKHMIDNDEIQGKYLEIEGIFVKIRPITQELNLIDEFSCKICSKEIKDVREQVLCPNCFNQFHRNHILEWIKNKAKYPVCQENLTEEILLSPKD